MADILRPGQRISIGAVNNAGKDAGRAVHPTADVGQEIIRGPGNISYRDARPPDAWIKITGQRYRDDSGSEDGEFEVGSVGSDGPPGGCLYSWVYVDDSETPCDPSEVAAQGVGFVDRFPAREMSGKEDVPVGSIVRAFMSRGWTHYCFKYADPQGTSDQVIFGHVSGAATTQSGVDFYPAYVWELSDPNDGASAYADSTAIWIRSVTAQPLTTGGVYTCLLQLGEYDVGGDSRPLYGTRDRQVMIGCDAGVALYYS